MTEIAQGDPVAEPMSVDEIGEHMAATMEHWPKLLRAMDV